MKVDFRALRSRFPSLAERSYFAMQCLGAFPAETLDDLEAYRKSLLLRNRSIPEWTERLDEMGALTAQLLGVSSDEVMLRGTATSAHAAIAACMDPVGARNRIVVSSADFHSTRYLWHGQSARGFDIVEIDGNGPQHADPGTYLDAIDERVSIVALSLVSPRNGALLDVRPIVERAHAAGAIVVLDAYQAVGIVPVRPRELGVDVLVGGNHKWLGAGGMGLAFAYVSTAFAESKHPVYPGWIGHREMLGFSDDFVPARGAKRFQQGTPALEPIYTSRAGLRFALEVGVSSLRERSVALTDRLIARADAHGLGVRTPRDAARRGGMIVLDIADPEPVIAELSAAGIDADCRPGAGIRLGPHVCLELEECDQAVDAIARAVLARHG